MMTYRPLTLIAFGVLVLVSGKLGGSTTAPVSVTKMAPDKADQAHLTVPKMANWVGPSAFTLLSSDVVHYIDQASLGGLPNGDGWLLRGTVRLSKNDTVTSVSLNLIMDTVTGRLVVGYTDPNPDWPEATYPPSPLEDISAEAGWVMGSEIPDSMLSSVADVLNAAWQRFGADPAGVGQILVRPRWITPRLPAREVNGTLVPVRPTQKVWIVQVCGTKMVQQGDKYFTQRFIQLEDGSLKFAWGFFAP